MSYYQALGLSREPFSNSPDPDMLYRSRTHLECLQHMEIAVRLRRGLNVVLGEVGTGKTTLSRELIRLLTQDGDIEVHLLEDPRSPSATEFLLTLARLFGLDAAAAGGNAALLKDAIKDWLLTRGQEGGRIVALLIDEGQKITPDCLELLRELLNFETNTHKLLQIVIFAQSEFEATLLARPNLDDRVNFRYRLLPLNRLETRRMIETRLALCAPEGSAPAAVFTQLALRRIYRLTRGYPRKIVRLCHLSMLLAVGFGKRRIGWKLVGQASREVTGPGRLWLRRLVLAGAGAGLASLCLYFAAPALPSVRLAALDALGRLQTSLRAGAPEAGALPASRADTLAAAPASGNQASGDQSAAPAAAPTLGQDAAAPAETAPMPAKILAAKDSVGRVVAAATSIPPARPDQAAATSIPPARPDQAEAAAPPAGSVVPAPAVTSAGTAENQGPGAALSLAAAALPPELAARRPAVDLAKVEDGRAAAVIAPAAPEASPAPATGSLPATLGASRVPVGWVVTRQAARIYGSGNGLVMARIAKANPGLDCNLVHAGDTITFPAIPADPLPQGASLIRVASTDSLEKGFAIITRHRAVEPVLSLYCTHQPGLGLRFDVVLAREYSNRQEAEAALAGLPRELAEGAVVVDRFPAGTVAFTDLGLWHGRRPEPKPAAPASRQVAVTTPVPSPLP